MDGRTGILLSKSTTTGRLDWMHGELWLFPDGLLRIPRGWRQTILSTALFFNPRRPQLKIFDAKMFHQLISNPRNRWIDANAIQSAQLRHGLTTDELLIIMLDGSQRHLLWMSRDRAFYSLQASIASWIGDRLTFSKLGIG